jgi:UDP-N-acetylmuramoyl-tripeptide--D-alanyl-D-alanine ligase
MTTALWTSKEVQVATAGKLVGDWSATGVSIDTRTLKQGDLFIAIEGPNFDGHKFVSNALSKGAAAALISHVPDDVDPKANLLIVDNTLKALEKLAAASRARTSARIIAVTGSVGKTSAKEALKHVLSVQGETYATEGSLNNHWGLPLSLARMPSAVKFGVFELGMNHPGEIEPLAKLTRPHVVLITTIEAVHSAHFKNIEEIADAKAEIFKGLEPGGTVILNRDNSQFAYLNMKAHSLGIQNTVSFGSNENADLKLVKFQVGADHSNVSAQFKEDVLQYRISIPGHHWVLNSLGVLGGVAAAGGDIVAAAIALSQLSPIKGRGQSYEVQLKDGAFTLIDDSYNASPVSVAASLAVLGRIYLGKNGRRIAVLGDMLELGVDSVRRHEELSEPLRENNIDLVFTAGTDIEALSRILPNQMRGGHASTSEKLAPIVQNAIRSGDAVSIKGSAGSKMSVIVQALLAMDKNLMSAAPLAANGA